MYKKARAGKIPLHPELEINTGTVSLEKSIESLIKMLTLRGYIKII
jgi:adenylylsulfate kinase-like enzyme